MLIKMCGCYGDIFNSEEEEDEEDSNLENQYYNSKALKEESLEEALVGFQKVLSLQVDNYTNRIIINNFIVTPKGRLENQRSVAYSVRLLHFL